MIFEFYGDHSKLDPMTRDIILQERYEDLIDEGYSKEEAKMMIEMLKYELDDY